MSFDHKPTNEDETDRIEEAGKWVDDEENGMGTNRINGQLAVSRSIGDHKYKDNAKISWDKQAVTACPDIKVFDRTPEDDFFINACDGIWDHKTNEECVKLVHEEKAKLGQFFKITDTISPIMEDNLKALDKYGRLCGTDNMTMMVVFFKNA